MIKYLINNYFVLDMYIKNNIHNKKFIVYICREIYIVNNLKTKLLFYINIIILERIIVNLNIKQFTIDSC